MCTKLMLVVNMVISIAFKSILRFQVIMITVTSKKSS